MVDAHKNIFSHQIMADLCISSSVPLFVDMHLEKYKRDASLSFEAAAKMA